MDAVRRWALRGLLALLVLLLFAAAAAWWLLQRSLPEYVGARPLAGLAAAVIVQRDERGVATIQADSRADALRALGFVHAQERYFEMDLMRRSAAGELAELFGAAALPLDRARRPHRFRARAAAVLDAAGPADRNALAAYVEGINAGLQALPVRPFPYLLLRQAPREWVAADTVLVVHAMFIDLQDEDNAAELARADLLRRAPAGLAAALTAGGTGWDAPLDGTPLAEPSLPDPSEIDLRRLPTNRFGHGAAVGGDLGIGSNNFAVGGALTASGAALVANDMHLTLRVPNIWFRARLRFAADDGHAVDVTGVTLPGVPGVVVGSNGHVAWAFTNSYGDWLDWIEVQWADAAHTRYRTPDGEATAVEHHELIAVAGAEPEEMLVRETIWGPILHERHALGSLALAWTAHRPQAVGFGLSRLETARSVADALAIAPRAGSPAQNLVIGDRAGRVAWTIAGAIPARGSADPTTPADWSTPGAGWQGWIGADRHPVVADPVDHRVWTANARVASGEHLALIGDGGYALGARAMQIRDGLRARERFVPDDLLAIQLDDRTLFLRRWWELLRATLAKSTGDPALAELDRLTAQWDERALPGAVAYRLVRGFRLAASATVLDGLAAPLRTDADPDYRLPPLQQGEGLVWRLVTERPAHLLPQPHADWDALLAAAARRVVDELGALPGGLAARTWGERNTTAIRHPLSRAVPGLGALLDLPAQQLPGDTAMPRVQGPSFGASQRMVVSPGREAEGYFHMPGGQSGHPLSPYYHAGHQDWAEGAPTPFLPGAPVHSLRLEPAAG
jgi:penicillin amidase